MNDTEDVKFDPTNWEGDGLPEDDDEALELCEELGMLPPDLEGLYDISKREGWVREKVANHLKQTGGEDEPYYRATSAWYWRRAQRWKELREKMLSD